MSRRHTRFELDFGSDSFLDIIANIVGILIILIVIAGVRVSKAPVLTVQSEPEPEMLLKPVPPPEDLDPPRPVLQEKKEITKKKEARKSQITQWQAPEPIQVVRHPSPELLREIHRLKGGLRNLSEEIRSRENETRRSVGMEDDLSHQYDMVLKQLGKESSASKDKSESLDTLQVALNTSKSEFMDLQDKLKQEKNVRPPVKKIEHKLTPISHKVEGDEVHFRIYRGRVAYVPIEELIERLRTEIPKHKSRLMKFRRNVGKVGPVDGFRMNYVMERQRLSPIEELQQGTGMIRITLTEWQIQPEADLDTESAEEALQPSSGFIRALRLAETGATLTFWVYPDSFQVFRKLQKLAHQEGFAVAARPLPFGVQIAGSPQGTRSAGQ